jgi:Rad3-related DNA helicase
MTTLKKDLAKYQPRTEQQDCLDFIEKTLEEKPNTKFFLLDLPTGIGKSYLALMIAELYTKRNFGARFDIITNSKLLQDQYSSTFQSINDLKGKENYECETYGCSCAQGSEFARLNKKPCSDCPHSSARDSFINGKISLTNFYLFILYSLYMPKVLESRGSNILIVDECHTLDTVISDFISIKITETILKRLQISDKETIKRLKEVKTIESYVEFLEYLAGEIPSTIDQIEGSLSSEKRSVVSDKRDNRVSKVLGGKSNDIKMMQLVTDLQQYQSKIQIFLKEYKADPHNWVLESQYNEKTRQNELSLEPIWAYNYLDQYIFSRYDAVFLMSGTILDKNLFCQLNGLDVQSTVYYSIPSPFPDKNRPIYYMPLGKMSYAAKENTFKNYIPFIGRLLNKYKDSKGIIHTNSFELSNWIQKSIDNPRLVFHESSNKDEVLQAHFNTKEASVIVSPSMDTGVSFDDDKARFQIVAKVPYPSLASQKNKMRQKINPDWYAYRTVQSILQIFGRVVRSSSDQGDTIIIDGSFGDVMKYSSHYIPQYIQRVIQRIDVKIPVK